LVVSDLELDTQTLEVKRANQLIQLTPQEFKLLEYLLQNKGRVLTREMILNRVWMASPEIETRVVDVYIGYLRKKIDQGAAKKIIQSIRGFGYLVKD
jgi:DNA-binding response OmpR family regulator